MNFRWLWFNHFPPGLELTDVERHKAKKMASAHWSRSNNYRNAHRIYLWVLLPFAIVSVAVLIGGFSMRKHLPISPFAIYLLILGPGIVYSVHRARRPYIRKALNDLGHPVCIDCGYLLKNLPDDVRRCPECGAEREQTSASPDPPMRFRQ